MPILSKMNSAFYLISATIGSIMPHLGMWSHDIEGRQFRYSYSRNTITYDYKFGASPVFVATRQIFDAHVVHWCSLKGTKIQPEESTRPILLLSICKYSQELFQARKNILVSRNSRAVCEEGFCSEKNTLHIRIYPTMHKLTKWNEYRKKHLISSDAHPITNSKFFHLLLGIYSYNFCPFWLMALFKRIRGRRGSFQLENFWNRYLSFNFKIEMELGEKWGTFELG